MRASPTKSRPFTNLMSLASGRRSASGYRDGFVRGITRHTYDGGGRILTITDPA